MDVLELVDEMVDLLPHGDFLVFPFLRPTSDKDIIILKSNGTKNK